MTTDVEWAQQQLRKFTTSFEDADRDKSGALSMDEVVMVLLRNGFKGSKEDVKDLFQKLDMNKDGKLTKQEFTFAMGRIPKITIRELALRKAFNTIDKDKSGKLTRKEIQDAMNSTVSYGQSGLKSKEVAISKHKLEQLLEELERDAKDDVVDYEEFLRVLGMEETATVMFYIFHKLDKDQSGFLTKRELMDAIDKEPELRLRAAKISDLLVALHKDADQKLDYKEFVQQWVKFK